ncbi:DUF5446 family protein [Bacillus sp. NPDC093026]|uniref:DUF5446 family protein n=1 Tax=Bacillus sp. NPDC093026 TaxID=3363948 RepID=UPI0038225104
MMNECVSKESIMQMLAEIERKLDEVEATLSVAVQQTKHEVSQKQERMLDHLESEVKDCELKIHTADYKLSARPAFHAG